MGWGGGLTLLLVLQIANEMNSSRDIFEVAQQQQTNTNVSFRVTLLVLDTGRSHIKFFFWGGVIYVLLFLKTSQNIVCSTQISWDALEECIEVQTSIICGDDISRNDILFLLGSVRRRYWRKAEDTTGEPPETNTRTLVSQQ